MATTKSPAHDGGALKNSLIAVALVGVVASLVSFYFFGLQGFVGTALGGAIAVANLWAVSRIVRGIIEEPAFRARWSLLAVMKLTTLVGVVFTLVTSGIAPIIPLAIGYAALPVGVVIGQLWTPTSTDQAPLRDQG